MTTLEMIELIAIALIVVGLTLYYLVLAIKNKWLSKLSTSIVNAMKYAESHFKTGSEKKEYVLFQVQKVCEELGIPYTFIKKLVDKFIEKTIKGYNNMIK